MRKHLDMPDDLPMPLGTKVEPPAKKPDPKPAGLMTNLPLPDMHWRDREMINRDEATKRNADAAMLREERAAARSNPFSRAYVGDISKADFSDMRPGKVWKIGVDPAKPGSDRTAYMFAVNRSGALCMVNVGAMTDDEIMHACGASNLSLDHFAMLQNEIRIRKWRRAQLMQSLYAKTIS